MLRADRVLRQGDEVLVFMGSATLRLPASRVASVAETASKPPERLNVESSRASSEAPAPAAASAPSEGPAWSAPADLSSLVRRGDLAAAEALALSRREDPLHAVALGEILLLRARPGDASDVLRGVRGEALGPTLRRARDIALAEALSRLRRADEARQILDRTPEDASGRVAQARAEIDGDAALAQRPAVASAHFEVVAPEGTRTLATGALMRELEAIHATLAAELGGAPEDRVTVLLYPGSEFWEATGEGRHVAALYDGRVRVPAQRLDPPTPALSEALRHEVAHAFVDALSGGRADAQWQEGIAGHFGDPDASRTTAELRAALSRDPEAWPPEVTHETAHARLEWFLGRWGMEGVRGVLRGMASRGTIEASVRAVTGLSGAELDEAWRRDLLAGRR